MSELVIVNEQKDSNGLANALMERLAQVIDDTDEQAAMARVEALRRQRPLSSPSQLADKLIYDKCMQTAVIGAVSSGASVIPGLGSFASLTVGVAADISLTFKAQAELVIEIAALYNHPLAPDEKRRIVLLVTGASAGANAVARRTGRRIAVKTGEKFAEKGIVKAIPFVGIGASAAANVAMTYAIGARAKAYFSLGPDEMLDTGATLRAITGVDGRKLAAGLRNTSRDRPAAIAAAGRSAKQLAGKAGQGVKGVGTAVNTAVSRRRKQPHTVLLPSSKPDDNLIS